MVSFSIGEKVFKTKKEAIEYTQKKINGMNDGYKGKGDDDYIFINDLLNNHPEKVFKIGCGVDKYHVSSLYNGKCVTILRTDGSCVLFSWKVCCGCPPKTGKQNLITCMRVAIMKQIYEYKDKHITCEKCGDFSDFLEIHHVKKFSELVGNFLSETKLNVPEVFDDDTKTHIKFKECDFDFEIAWRRYHRKMSTLMCLCEKCHDNITHNKK